MAATGILADKTIRATLKAAVQAGKPRKISDGGGLVPNAPLRAVVTAMAQSGPAQGAVGQSGRTTCGRC